MQFQDEYNEPHESFSTIVRAEIEKNEESFPQIGKSIASAQDKITRLMLMSD